MPDPDDPPSIRTDMARILGGFIGNPYDKGLLPESSSLSKTVLNK